MARDLLSPRRPSTSASVSALEDAGLRETIGGRRGRMAAQCAPPRRRASPRLGTSLIADRRPAQSVACSRICRNAARPARSACS